MNDSIEWGISWNPVKGRCLHSGRCPYCYMTSFHRRFNMDITLRLDEAAIKQSIPKKPRIFVCSNLDLFAADIPNWWIETVIGKVRANPDKDFFFLTKNPARYGELIFPKNAWLGTTWDGLEFTQDNVDILYHGPFPQKFVSFEPLLADPAGQSLDGLSWIMIGADSRKGHAKDTKITWVMDLIRRAREMGIPVFVKKSIKGINIKEFPILTGGKYETGIARYR